MLLSFITGISSFQRYISMGSCDPPRNDQLSTSPSNMSLTCCGVNFFTGFPALTTRENPSSTAGRAKSPTPCLKRKITMSTIASVVTAALTNSTFLTHSSTIFFMLHFYITHFPGYLLPAVRQNKIHKRLYLAYCRSEIIK